jgi:cell wall-associated NlpC family hydrolase
MSKHSLKTAFIASGIAVAALFTGVTQADAATQATGFSVVRNMTSSSAPLLTPAVTRWSTGAHIANYIQAYDMGKPYVFGATGPYSFDCSGLVMSAAHKIGDWAMPRTAEAQYQHVTRISYGNRRYGDLVFFHDSSGYVYHVGVYIGTYWFQGKVQPMMVAAPYPGRDVRREAIFYNGLSGYVTFGRP